MKYITHLEDGDGGYVRTISWSPDATRLAIGRRDDGDLRVVDAVTGALIYRVPGCEQQICSVAWSPDGSRIAGASLDYTARIFDAETGRTEWILRDHGNRVDWVTWSPYGDYLFSYGREGRVIKWDANTLDMLLEKDAKAWGGNHIVDVSSNGERLAVIALTPTEAAPGAAIWDAETFETLGILPAEGVTRLRDIAWSPDDAYVISGGDNGVFIWDAETFEPVKAIYDVPGNVYAVAWSSDGRYFAAGGKDSFLYIWDAETYEKVLDYSPPGGMHVVSIVWDPWGFDVAVGTACGYLMVFECY